MRSGMQNAGLPAPIERWGVALNSTVDLANKLRRHLLRNRAQIKLGPAAVRRAVWQKAPAFPRLICELEWILSATEGVVRSFHLEQGRLHDILWQRSNEGGWSGQPMTAVAVAAKSGATRTEAAEMLLHAHFKHAQATAGLTCFYGISETGLLSVAQIRGISEAMWG